MSSSKMSGLGMTLQTPPQLVEPNVDGSHTLTTLERTDQRFQEISVDFKNAGMNVIQVEMLQNSVLWKRYATERNLILEQREKIDPDFKINERYLYHGTSVKKSYICDEGLDSRMSNEGCFGKGIYFSDFPKKCVKYAKRGNGGDETYILLARVILGVPKVFPNGKKARALKREPEKEEPYTGHRFYDSVEGCPVNHKEFVVYDNRRALVEGIITFTVEQKEKKAKKKPEPVEEKEEDLDNFNNLDGNISDSDNDTGSENDESKACSGESSSDEDEEAGQDEEAEGASDSDSSNSEQSSNTSDSDIDINKDFKTDDDLAQMLVQKRRQFGDATGETEEFEVERYLLRGGMDVQAAIKIYEEKKAQGFPESESDDDDDLQMSDHPLPDSDAWKQLSKEDQEVFIESQIDDFLCITGLDVDERGLARKCLSAVNMHLDHAVLAYYEDEI